MNHELLCCGKVTKLGRPKIALSVFGSKSFFKIGSPLKSNMANRTAHSKNCIQHDKQYKGIIYKQRDMTPLTI